MTGTAPIRQMRRAAQRLCRLGAFRFVDDSYRPPPTARRPLRLLIWSDYQALYAYSPESVWRRRLLAGPRIVTNPSMHATILIRLALHGPRGVFWLWRNILISKHSMDVLPHCQIGSGLVLPHPWGLAIGCGVVLGENVMLMQNVVIGTSRVLRPGEALPTPRLEDGVVVHGGAVIAGGITVGAECIIGAGALVVEDVPPRSLVRGMRPGSVEPLTTAGRP